MGSKVNGIWRENDGIYDAFKWHCKKNIFFDRNDRNAVLSLLLSVGADPLDCNIPEELKPQIQLWLSGVESAKQGLAAIFDNAALEKEVIDFLFHETFLRKALNQC